MGFILNLIFNWTRLLGKSKRKGMRDSERNAASEKQIEVLDNPKFKSIIIYPREQWCNCERILKPASTAQHVGRGQKHS